MCISLSSLSDKRIANILIPNCGLSFNDLKCLDEKFHILMLFITLKTALTVSKNIFTYPTVL